MTMMSYQERMAYGRNFRSLRVQGARRFAAALADGRSVAHMAMGTTSQPVVAVAVPKIGAQLAKLTERVTDVQVAANHDWMRAATEYARNYTGTFDFMVDMKSKVEGGLSISQMRGILNCMRAEAIRIVAERAVTKPVAATAEVAPVKTLGEVLDGFYTVVFEGSHVTIRINSLSAKQSRDGKAHRFASYLCGPINTSDYRRFAEIKTNTYRSWGGFDKQRAALDILMSAGSKDQTAFGKAYAKAATRCYRCGKLLTEPESIESGIGPICAGRE